MEHSRNRLAISLMIKKSSGVSRCLLCYIFILFFSPPGGVRRSKWHCGRGVRQLVGLGCLESQRLDGGAGDVVGIVADGDAGAGL